MMLLAGLMLTLRAAHPPRHALGWDVFGYYLYLPAAVIHGDPALRDHAWLDALMERYEPSSTLYQLVDGPDGARVIKYSMGMALAYAPFFLAAHVLAPLLGYPADGLSPPYQWGVTWGCMLYVLLGLFLFRALLLRFFDDRWTALLLVLVVAGTHHLHLAAWDGTLLTHPLLFTLVVLLLLLTLSWHRVPSFLIALALGAVAGFITLVRPSEVVCLLIPLAWGWHDANARRTTWRLWREHGSHLLIAALAFIVVCSPQAVYWRTVTGEWLFYSYANNPGEGFRFARPYLVDYLFSFRKGWLLYTPIMAMALLGIPLLWSRMKRAAPAITLFTVVSVWVAASWTTWWYAGGSFSARSMMPVQAVLALPMGLSLQALWSRSSLRVPTAVLLVALVLFDLFQTWQWTRGIISRERMTKAYYAAIFCRTQVPSGATDLLLVERSDEAVLNESLYKATRVLLDTTFAQRPEEALVLSDALPFSPGVDRTFRDITAKDHAWIRTTATWWADSATREPPLLVMAFHHQGEPYQYRTATWPITDERAGWTTLRMEYLTPEVRSADDNLKVYIWNMHGGDHRIGMLRVEVFERRE